MFVGSGVTVFRQGCDCQSVHQSRLGLSRLPAEQSGVGSTRGCRVPYLEGKFQIDFWPGSPTLAFHEAHCKVAMP
jgi:hypothetical protein